MQSGTPIPEPHLITLSSSAMSTAQARMVERELQLRAESEHKYLLIITHGVDNHSSIPVGLPTDCYFDWSNRHFSRGRYDSNYRKCGMDDDCYSKFDQQELHTATRPIRKKLLDQGVVGLGCRHGLHRSVSGGRHLGQELGREGHRVRLLNLGCHFRWWARQHGSAHYGLPPPVPTATLLQPEPPVPPPAAPSPPHLQTSVAERPLQSGGGGGGEQPQTSVAERPLQSGGGGGQPQTSVAERPLQSGGGGGQPRPL